MNVDSFVLFLHSENYVPAHSHSFLFYSFTPSTFTSHLLGANAYEFDLDRDLSLPWRYPAGQVEAEQGARGCRGAQRSGHREADIGTKRSGVSGKASWRMGCVRGPEARRGGSP